MAQRLTDRMKFWLERFLLRGPQYRLLFIAAVIGLLSVLSGALVATSGVFESYWDAVWWAFLRLSDPGYLGDDEGVFVRAVSTFLTVAGYVVFLGSLVAIMTQWLNATMTRLESGLTPVTRRDHVLVLGWTNRTVAIVREILLSEERVRRLLHHHGARSLQIVILAEEVTAALRQDLKEQLEELWDEGRITLRTGSSMRIEHLERVDFLNAAVILVPGADLGPEGAVALDTRTIKTLLSISSAAAAEGADHPPYVVAEIFDARKVSVARRAYRGPLELVASDAAIARLLAQNLRHPGLSHVYGELLSHGNGNEIYLPEAEELVGETAEGLQAAFPGGVVLGVVRAEGARVRPYLNPPAGFRVEAGDRIAVMARAHADVRGPARGRPSPVARGEAATFEGRDGTRRVLVLGWSHKVPALLREFGTYHDERFEVVIVTTVSVERRETHLQRYGIDETTIQVRHVVGDFTSPQELLRLDPMDFDGIVLMGSDWLPSGQEADARTILGALLLQELAAKRADPPEILVEILDPENAALLDRGIAEVLVTPVLVSHVLAQVSLRRELLAVFDELFSAGGAEVVFRPPALYGLEGRARFSEVHAAVSARGETALGVRTRREDGVGDVALNPDRGLSWEMGEGTEIVALATYRG